MSMWFKIPGYQRNAIAVRQGHFIYTWSAIRLYDQRPVFIKTYNDILEDQNCRHLLRHDFEIGNSLEHINIMRYLEIIEKTDVQAVILEDFDAQPLLIPEKGFSVSSFFQLSLQILKAVEYLHKSDIIHTRINTQSIFLSSLHSLVKLSDFEFAYSIRHHSFQCKVEPSPEDNVYIAPELADHTAIPNCKSDLFSLGIVFAEMLTGVKPYLISNDQTEIVKDYLALLKKKATIPKALYEIINLLLKENQQERYLSVSSLLSDMTRLSELLVAKAPLTGFELYPTQESNVLIFSERIIGRKEEQIALQESILRGFSERTSLLFVSGTDGLGKTTLVKSMYSMTKNMNGLYIYSQCEEQMQDYTYPTLRNLLLNTTKELQKEPHKKLKEIAQLLYKEIGKNIQVLIEFEPAIEKLFGSQLELSNLSIYETKARFDITVYTFFYVIHKYYSLLFVIDDVQNIDESSLQVIMDLYRAIPTGMTLVLTHNPSIQFRKKTNELLLPHLQENSIHLHPFNKKSTKEWLTINLQKKNIDADFVKLLHEKTKGNPLQLRYSLLYFYRTGMLHKIDSFWEWDLLQIENNTIITDLSSIIIDNITNLTHDVKATLQLIAIHGNSIEFNELSSLCDEPIESLQQKIDLCVTNGILTHNAECITFDHTLFQKELFNQIPKYQPEQLHIDIAFKKLKHEPISNLSAIDVAQHLLLGRSMLTEEDIDLAAGVFFKAGTIAYSLCDFKAAMQFFDMFLSCSNDAFRASHRKEIVLVFCKIAEIYGFEHEYENAVLYFNLANDYADALEEEVDICVAHITLEIANKKVKEAIHLALRMCSDFGIKIPSEDWKEHNALLEKEIETCIASHELSELVHDHQPENVTISYAIKILTLIENSAYEITPEFGDLITLTVAKLCLLYGHVTESCKAYSFLGMYFSKQNKSALAYDMGNLALKLCNLYNDDRQFTQVTISLGGFLQHRVRPYESINKLLLQGAKAGIFSGNLSYSLVNLIHHVILLFVQNSPVHTILGAIDQGILFAQTAKQQTALDSFLALSAIFHNLAGHTESIDIYQFAEQEEENLVHYLKEHNSYFAYGVFYHFNAFCNFLYNNTQKAHDAIVRAREQRKTIRATPLIAEQNLLESIIMLEMNDISQNTETDAMINQLQQELHEWALSSPENYMAYYLLVEAEIAKSHRYVLQANELYDQSIKLFKKQNRILWVAIASERAAKLWATSGNNRFTISYLMDAWNGYTEWGAIHKIKQLETIYSLLMENYFLIAYKNEFQPKIESLLNLANNVHSELDCNRLVQSMMTFAAEHTAADTVILSIVKKESMIVEGVIDKSHKYQHYLGGNTELLPYPAGYFIRHCEHSGSSIILNDPKITTESSYEVSQIPRSVIAFPLIRETQLLGILYLASEQSYYLFPKQQIELIRMILLHAVISIYNAHLYQDLMDQESLLRNLLLELPSGIAIRNNTGQHLLVNKKWASMRFIDSNQIIGKRDTEIYALENAKDLTRIHFDALRTNAPVYLNETIHSKDGVYYYYTICYPLQKENSKNWATCVISIDISSQKLFEDKLHLTQFSLDNASIAVYWFNENGYIFYVNNEGCKDTGYTQEELYRMRITDLDSSFSTISWFSFLEKMKKMEHYSLESTFRTKKGSTFPVEISCNYVKYRDNDFLCTFVNDISQRKSSEKAVYESDSKYRFLAENISDVIWSCNLEFQHDYISSSIEKFQGYTVSEFMQLSFSDSATAESFDYATKRLSAEIADLSTNPNSKYKNVTLHAELQYKHKNGHYVWGDLTYSYKLSSGNQVLGLFGVTHDITERKNAEEALRKSELAYRLLFDHSIDGVSIIVNDLVVEVNLSIQQMLQLSYQEIIGKKATDFVHADDKPIIKRIVENNRDIPDVESNILKVLRADGSSFLGEIKAKSIDWNNNRALQIIVRDVTESKKAENAIIKYNELLKTIHQMDQSILQNKPIHLIAEIAFRHIMSLSPYMFAVIIRFDHDNQTANCVAQSNNETNNMLFSLKEFTAMWDERETKTFITTIDKLPTEFSFAHTANLQDTGAVLVYPLFSQTLLVGCMYVFCQNTITPTESDATVIQELCDVLAVAIQQNRMYEQILSHSAKLEERVKDRTSQLEAANQELSAFSYSVSHDLRSPLRAIDGFSTALLEDCFDQVDDTAKDYILRIRKATHKMGKLIDDILYLSRVTRAELKKEKVNISLIAEKVLLALQESNLSRTVNCIIENNMYCYCDRNLISIVVENLLNNAWKYTSKHSSARIEFGTTIQDEKRVFFIKDDGAGFDMKYVNKLFSAFQRLHGISDFEGNGIGLATVQRIIHRHSGSIWVSAEIEKGATFYFYIPDLEQSEEV